jgi:catechol 2,3-dioxygenase-like lactoylglutathione lyase family enzyme
MTVAVQRKFDVGGVLLERPFKVRRLGHFGFNFVRLEEALKFYTEVLGFAISDRLDLTLLARKPDALKDLGDTGLYFLHYGSDHHSFVMTSTKVIQTAFERAGDTGITINQISWMVGSLAEVVNASRWLPEQGLIPHRNGRDMPGSNWHTYFPDPDGHTNELFYGMEQIGWNGRSKPTPMNNRGFQVAPTLPQMSEFDEIQTALSEGVDVNSGYRHIDPLPAVYDVDGILLRRPFKIVRLGPVRLFVDDVDLAKAFYRDMGGFSLTEEVVWQGHRCAFLRANTEHHSMALYPKALREILGLSTHTTCMSFGLQLANYRQLRDAMEFLKSRGYTVRELPPELSPGIDYSAFVIDPDGHALQMYYKMEQIGWDGKPRPAHERVPVRVGEWPDQVDGGDAYVGEPYMGPWG